MMDNMDGFSFAERIATVRTLIISLFHFFLPASGDDRVLGLKWEPWILSVSHLHINELQNKIASILKNAQNQSKHS